MAEYEYPFLSHSHRQVKYTRPLEEPQQDEHVQSHLAENVSLHLFVFHSCCKDKQSRAELFCFDIDG